MPGIWCLAHIKFLCYLLIHNCMYICLRCVSFLLSCSFFVGNLKLWIFENCLLLLFLIIPFKFSSLLDFQWNSLHSALVCQCGWAIHLDPARDVILFFSEIHVDPIHYLLIPALLAFRWNYEWNCEAYPRDTRSKEWGVTIPYLILDRRPSTRTQMNAWIQEEN